MKQDKKITCPICHGEKVIGGVCQCSAEWRGTKGDNGWEDCQCTPDLGCTTCKGTGVVEPGQKK